MKGAYFIEIKLKVLSVDKINIIKSVRNINKYYLIFTNTKGAVEEFEVHSSLPQTGSLLGSIV